MTLTDIGTLILAIATTASLIYISRQVRVTRQQTKGEFLLALDDRFEKSYPISLRLVNEPNFAPEGNDWIEIWKLMSVFERIHIMVEDGILDIGLVERLYGFQLLTLIANDNIFQRLEATGAEWQDFIDLCYAVADYRQQAGADDPRSLAFAERVHKLNKQTRRLNDPWRIQN